MGILGHIIHSLLIGIAHSEDSSSPRLLLPQSLIKYETEITTYQHHHVTVTKWIFQPNRTGTKKNAGYENLSANIKCKVLLIDFHQFETTW